MLYCFFCVNSLHENSNKHFALLERISSSHNFSNRLYHIFVNKSRRSLVYHSQLVAVYHQCEALHIIKPQVDARWRVMRYKGGSPPLMIYTALRAAMICQACDLDKQKQNICRQTNVLFLLAERLKRKTTLYYHIK